MPPQGTAVASAASGPMLGLRPGSLDGRSLAAATAPAPAAAAAAAGTAAWALANLALEAACGANAQLLALPGFPEGLAEALREGALAASRGGHALSAPRTYGAEASAPLGSGPSAGTGHADIAEMADKHASTSSAAGRGLGAGREGMLVDAEAHGSACDAAGSGSGPGGVAGQAGEPGPRPDQGGGPGPNPADPVADALLGVAAEAAWLLVALAAGPPAHGAPANTPPLRLLVVLQATW